ncbi:hypothetical protein CIPAW_04G110400 [Carya illinoinensis]|uniref:Uncharacterized protein n=1 Tax=Carya illinoinensis TaxID=32201 RepID=A0A8T1QUU0_CARIL|nr:hypothetical protein CIPAW_04G110400 [Carya illinoinensis]
MAVVKTVAYCLVRGWLRKRFTVFPQELGCTRLLMLKKYIGSTGQRVSKTKTLSLVPECHGDERLEELIGEKKLKQFSVKHGLGLDLLVSQSFGGGSRCSTLGG